MPATDENEIGANHTVTFTVKDVYGNLVADTTTCTYSITWGPNQGRAETNNTVNGISTWTYYYGGPTAGKDKIQATATSNSPTPTGSVTKTVEKSWVVQATPPAPGGTFDQNVVPKTTCTYDLGSSTLKWKDLYLNGNLYLYGGYLDLSNMAGDSHGVFMKLPGGAVVGSGHIHHVGVAGPGGWGLNGDSYWGHLPLGSIYFDPYDDGGGEVGIDSTYGMAFKDAGGWIGQ